MTSELGEEMIAEAMVRAEKVACRPGDDRCYPFPDPVAEAQVSCTSKGRCLIGGTRRVIVAESGRTRWDARPARESCSQDARGVGS
jgi:hypothetical protein